MYLDFELCDLQQNVLIRLDNRRSGGYAEVGLNKRRNGFCPLSLVDDARDIAKSIETVLRITLKGPGEFSRPLMIGRVIVPQEKDDGTNEQLGLTAIDPMFQLDLKMARKVVGATWEAMRFEGVDQSQIMWELIASVTGHGVAQGSLPVSLNRDRTYPAGKEIGVALVQMSEVIDGPDFELEPVITGDGTLCKFNTFYPRQGEDKSATVRFVMRGDPHTAKSYGRDPGGNDICNRVLAIGAPTQEATEGSPFAIFPGYVAEHPASIAALENAFERRLQFEDVVETATLEAHAKAAVAAAAFPIDFFEFDPAPEPLDDEVGDGVPPIFGVDYWIGDTIGIDYYPPDADPDVDDPIALAGRLTDAKVTELDSGQLQTSLTCTPEVSFAGVIGSAVTVKVPQNPEV